MRLVYAISKKIHGNMKSLLINDREVYDSRHKFLEKNNINPNNTTLVKLSYDRKNYCEYLVIDDHSKGDGIIRDHALVADALVVTKPNHALFLPLADCIGAIIFDPKANILMLSHLGRHNLCCGGGEKSIEFICNKFNLNAKNLRVKLSPSAGKQKYPLFDFDNRSLTEVAIEQMVKAGVDKKNITCSSIDTTMDENYFSHSQFLAGNRQEDSRFAIVAMMKD